MSRTPTTVINTKQITVGILARYGSRSNTKMRTVKINGSLRFTLLTVRPKNGTVTVRYGTDTGAVMNWDLYSIWILIGWIFFFHFEKFNLILKKKNIYILFPDISMFLNSINKISSMNLILIIKINLKDIHKCCLLFI